MKPAITSHVYVGLTFASFAALRLEVVVDVGRLQGFPSMALGATRITKKGVDDGSTEIWLNEASRMAQNSHKWHCWRR